jgi:ATP-dependent helicase/nuclease subunit B
MGSSDKNHIDMGDALEAVSQGSLILTVNRRLSLEIGRQYNREQLEQGRQVWESANTISWSDWTQGLFQELVDHGLSDLILLTPHQANMLWEQIILRTDSDNSILRPTSAARMANDAWALVQAWGIEPEQLRSAATSETERFLTWVEDFRIGCRRNKWIDQALVPDLIAQGLSEAALKPPTEIILAGFDEITPQQQRLLDLLQDMGCQISYLLSANQSGSAQRFQAADITQELETAAGWAIKRLQQNSEARVGIVVPQLDKLHTEVKTIFKRYFDPKSILPDVADTPQPYNISHGITLTQCPLVVDGFLILGFAGGELSSGDLSRLLRSPFIFGSSQEMVRRCRLDAYIRNRVGERTISLDTLIRKTREFNRDDDACPVLLAALENFRRKLDHMPVKQSPQQWTDEFQAWLNALGWGRYEEMNSNEYQQIERFNQTMTSFQMLGQVQHSMVLHDAIDRLHAIAQETIFQPQGSDAPIQIVGTLEAAGLGFDHLWVIGLSDDKWPAPASPNPLLPVSIQRKLDMPHASPQRELAYSAAITQRLLASAGEVVVSHAETDGVNQLRVSPLVEHLPMLSLDDLDIAQVTDLSRLGFGSSELEEIVDNQAPPLSPGTHLTGGSGLLADQSACPFRAFAKHRLGARPVDDSVSGLDARIKGVMTHRILQQLWQQIGDQERLLSLVDSELRQLVTDNVAKELSRIRTMRPETFAPRFIEIEQQRVTQLILDWLELERRRTPFKAISLEQKETVNLAGLELDVVADRIDQLEDGTNLIIDYKTGKTITYKGWFEQRIGEPQLPLYATTNDTNVSGVFLAGVSRKNLRFSGVANRAEVVPGVKAFTDTNESEGYSGWDGLKADWKQRLELLAKEILAGRADVMPKDRNSDCTYCPLPALCRIHELEDSDMQEDQE